VWYGITRLARFNVLGYFLIAAMVAIASPSVELLRQPNPYFRANGFAVVAAALVVLAWPLVRRQPQ
jgi:membrane protein implicated in regulation of membrane protease activity